MDQNTHRQLLKKPFILPEDVLVFPVNELASHIRKKIDCEEDQYAITRPGMRTHSRIIDQDTASLLEIFRTPCTLVEGILQYSRQKKCEPQNLLEQAFPILQKFSSAGVLVPADSPIAHQIKASFAVGQMVGDYEVSQIIQALEDTEVYQAKDQDAKTVALKISRAQPSKLTLEAMVREADILAKLAGTSSPAFIASGAHKDHYFIASSWVSGVTIDIRANEIRNSNAADWREKLYQLCVHILEAYTNLHANGIVHGDVHVRNLMVNQADEVHILDFGLSRAENGATYLDHQRRAGMGLYMEPELARALLNDEEIPAANVVGEQYALAALCYYLICGKPIFDSPAEKEIRYQKILQVRPLPFASQGFESWPAIEAVLHRALSKNPADRFESVQDFAQALRQASLPLSQHPNKESDQHLSDQSWIKEIIARTTTLIPSLDTLFPKAPKASVQYGAAGLAWFFYRLAQLRDNPKLLNTADLWSRQALDKLQDQDAFEASEVGVVQERVGPASLYHRASGVHCIHAHISHARGDTLALATQIEQFIATSRNKSDDPELAFGNSGILLGGAQLYDLANYSAKIDTSPLADYLTEVANDIWQQMESQANLNKQPTLRHLGMAHGWAGIIYAQLVIRETLGLKLPLSLKNRLDQLAEFAEPLGRGLTWIGTISHPDQQTATPAYSPGWCSGTSGYVYLWTIAHRSFGDAKYLHLAKKAAWHVWEHPDRHTHLCCGMAGRAFALLRLYRNTGHVEWLDRARQLSQYIGEEMQNNFVWGDRTLGLFWGALGPALVSLELERPELAVMPLFEREGW